MQETADESSELRGLVQRDGRLELSPGTEDKASRSCSFMYRLWSPCGDTWGTPPRVASPKPEATLPGRCRGSSGPTERRNTRSNMASSGRTNDAVS